MGQVKKDAETRARAVRLDGETAAQLAALNTALQAGSVIEDEEGLHSRMRLRRLLLHKLAGQDL